MAHVVVLGAGLGGAIMAYELKDQLRPEDKVTVVTKDPKYHFVPSNPWIAVGWRDREDITVDLAPTMAKKGIDFIPVAAEKLMPEENRIELVDGKSVTYDYLVIATGPELAFDEIEGLGPQAATPSRSATSTMPRRRRPSSTSWSPTPARSIIGAAQGASCFGPAYEFLFILETALRRAKVRDRVPMTFVTPEPYIGHLGLDGVGDTKGLAGIPDARQAHQVDDLDPDQAGRGRPHVRRGDRRRRVGEGRKGPALRLLDDAARLPGHQAGRRDRGPVATRAASPSSTSTSRTRSTRTSSRSASASRSRRWGRPRCPAACRRPAS